MNWILLRLNSEFSTCKNKKVNNCKKLIRYSWHREVVAVVEQTVTVHISTYKDTAMFIGGPIV